MAFEFMMDVLRMFVSSLRNMTVEIVCDEGAITTSLFALSTSAMAILMIMKGFIFKADEKK